MLLSYVPTKKPVENNILSFPFLVKHCMTHPTREKSPGGWGSWTKGKNNNNKCSLIIVGLFVCAGKTKGEGGGGPVGLCYELANPLCTFLIFWLHFFWVVYCCCPSSPSCQWLLSFLGFFPELHLVCWSAMQSSLFPVMLSSCNMSSCGVPAKKAISTMQREGIRKWVCLRTV